MDTQKGTYHFTFNGAFLTNFLREISTTDMVKAIDIAMNDIGLNYQQAFWVCSGQMKLCNNTTNKDLLYLERDDKKDFHGKILYNEKLDMNVVELMPIEKNPFRI